MPRTAILQQVKFEARLNPLPITSAIQNRTQFHRYVQSSLTASCRYGRARAAIGFLLRPKSKTRTFHEARRSCPVRVPHIDEQGPRCRCALRIDDQRALTEPAVHGDCKS